MNSETLELLLSLLLSTEVGARIEKDVTQMVKDRVEVAKRRGEKWLEDAGEELRNVYRFLLISNYVQGEIEALPFFKGIPEDKALNIYLSAHHQAAITCKVDRQPSSDIPSTAYRIMSTLTDALRYNKLRTNSPSAELHRETS